jgi:hypothetical protein
MFFSSTFLVRIFAGTPTDVSVLLLSPSRQIPACYFNQTTIDSFQILSNSSHINQITITIAEIISSTLKMEAICSSETSVATQQTTRRHIPEDGTLQTTIRRYVVKIRTEFITNHNI